MLEAHTIPALSNLKATHQLRQLVLMTFVLVTLSSSLQNHCKIIVLKILMPAITYNSFKHYLYARSKIAPIRLSTRNSNFPPVDVQAHPHPTHPLPTHLPFNLSTKLCKVIARWFSSVKGSV